MKKPKKPQKVKLNAEEVADLIALALHKYAYADVMRKQCNSDEEAEAAVVHWLLNGLDEIGSDPPKRVRRFVADLLGHLSREYAVNVHTDVNPNDGDRSVMLDKGTPEYAARLNLVQERLDALGDKLGEKLK